MANVLCPELVFSNEAVQTLCGQSAIAGAQDCDAEAVADAEELHGVVVHLRAVTKTERGQSAVRRHKITSAATGTEFTAADRAQMTAQSGSIDEMKATLTRIYTTLQRLEAKSDNTKARIHNSASRDAKHMLRKLAKETDGENVGKLPPDDTHYPTTRGAVHSLNNAQLNVLENFYGETFEGRTTADRQQAFQIFIGN